MHKSKYPSKRVAVWLMAIVLTAGQAFATKRWETLQAINWVENPTDSQKVGANGELGPYQFRAATWYMHTHKPFDLALQRKYADEIAVRHYEWIKQGLEHNGIAATPYNIALAWNAGLDQVINGHIPASSRRYAVRVTNLVEDLEARQVASSP